MIKVNIFLEQIDDDVSEYELGHIEIIIDDFKISSIGKTPSQSMMIFITLGDLIDGILSLKENRKKEFYFVGTDSSFSFKLKMEKNRTKIIHLSGEKYINLDCFLIELYNSIKDLLKLYQLNEKSAVIGGLNISLDKIKYLITN